MFSHVAFLAFLWPLVAAIQFTSPPENSTLTKGSNVDVTWSFVDTDPEVFSIYLWNFVNFPPYYSLLAEDIDTSLSTYNVHIPCSVNSSFGYQFTAINGTNVYVIYAQSDEFFIEGDACVDPTPTSSLCAASPTTVTVTVTGPASLPDVTPSASTSPWCTKTRKSPHHPGDR